MSPKGHKRGPGGMGRWKGWNRQGVASVTVRHVEPTRVAAPMTGAQADYLKDLCHKAGEQFNPTWTKAQATKRIQQLKRRLK